MFRFLSVIYMIRYKKVNASMLNGKVAVQLIVTSVVEWIAVFLVIWFLTFMLNIPIELSTLIPIFLIASCAGIVSMIPGGIGSFDLVFLWGTQSVGIADEKVLFLLILYRMGYFVLPFLFSSLLFIKEYWERWNRSWDDLPNNVFQKISHTLLTIIGISIRNCVAAFRIRSRYFESLENCSRIFIFTDYECITSVDCCSRFYSLRVMQRD